MKWKLKIPGFESKNSRGVALIMVVWIITILTVVVLEFSFAMRTEVNITKNFKEELELYAIAHGGVQQAIAELILKHDPRVQQLRKTLKTEEVNPEKKEWVADGRPYALRFDQGECELRIMSESGKININTISEMTLRKLIGNLGLEGEKRDAVVDSILDWRDPDDLYRINGAENDYYQSLKEPYRCKNANLDSVQELLLVKGVTPDLFYGRRGPKEGEEGTKASDIGLKDIFSVYAAGEQVDVNSASLPVLRVALGLPSEVAKAILKGREEKGFQHQQDLLQRVPELSPLIAQISGRLVFSSTSAPLTSVYYTIESRGKSKEGGAVRDLKTIVKIDRMDKKGYKVIQWVDALFWP
jgi:general secretion pathway protein K